MEATKIESLADSDLASAAAVAVDLRGERFGLRLFAPEDAETVQARMKLIAEKFDELAAALKIARPTAAPAVGTFMWGDVVELSGALGVAGVVSYQTMVNRAQELRASINRHRETERRHRDQRAGICELLQTHWDLVGERVKELLEDQRKAIDVFGEIRAAAASAGLEHDMRPVDIVRQLSDMLKRVTEERGELLEEMARSADPEKVAVAASDLADQPEPQPDPPLGPLCENCREPLCRRCNRCHSSSREERCVLADPPCAAAELGDILPGALRIAHEALVATITISERDWKRSADLAWIYGVLVGWSADDLEELQLRFNWPDNVAQLIGEHRAALACAGMAE